MYEPHKKLCFKSGTRIFSIGDKGEDAYIVESGSVEISVEKDGEKIVVDTIGAKSIFGEMSAFGDGIRLVNATAVGHTEVYPIEPEKLENIVKDCPPFVQALVRIMVKTIQKLTVK